MAAAADREAKAAIAKAGAEHHRLNNKAVEGLSETLKIVLKIADPRDASILDAYHHCDRGVVVPAARRSAGKTPIATTTRSNSASSSSSSIRRNDRSSIAHCLHPSHKTTYRTIESIDELKSGLRGLCTTVFEALGKQQTEGAYQRALEIELKLRGVAVEKEVPIDIMYRGVKIGSRRVDLLVTLFGDKSQAIIEMKALKTVCKGGNSCAQQIEYYMDVFQVEHGFLVNFPHEAGFPPVPTGAVFRQELICGVTSPLSDVRLRGSINCVDPEIVYFQRLPRRPF